MPIKISPAIQKTFTLTESDDDLVREEGVSPTTIVVRQVTQGEVERRNDLFSEFSRTYGADGGITVKQNVSLNDMKRLEVFLTLAGCNIEDEDGTALFTFKDGRLENEVEFKKAWSKLPPVVAEEIHSKVLELNPMWGTEGETL